MTRFVFFTAVFLAISMQQAFALKCWQCNGQDNAICNDPFDAQTLDESISFVDCLPETPDDQAFCVKASIDGIITRRCVTTKLELDQHCSNEATVMAAAMIKSMTGKDSQVTCDQCTTDGCNGASQ